MRSGWYCAGAARARSDVRHAGAGAHRAARGRHRGLFPPFPDGIPGQARRRAPTVAFAQVLAGGARNCGTSAGFQRHGGNHEDDALRRRNGAIERRAPNAAR